MKIIRSFEPGDRYRYDFDLCSCARGWVQVDRLTATVIVLAVTAGLILALSIWRTRFALGPFELSLRQITYAGCLSGRR